MKKEEFWIGFILGGLMVCVSALAFEEPKKPEARYIVHSHKAKEGEEPLLSTEARIAKLEETSAWLEKRVTTMLLGWSDRDIEKVREAAKDQ